MSEDWIREHVRCCSCMGSMADSRHINLVSLDKYVTWDYPAWGNILVRDPDKRGARRACAVLCDGCVERRRKPYYAVEYAGEGDGRHVLYHHVDRLEDAPPITMEDLERGG